MDLSNELIERILEFVLVADGPIELAPLTIKASTGGIGHLGWAKDDPRARCYTNEVQPTLSVLRTNKTFCDLGVRAFYGQNAFRFSNRCGHYILACFLHLIGPKNVGLLRDVTVVCPAHAVYSQMSAADHLYRTVLSPLNMTIEKTLPMLSGRGRHSTAPFSRQLYQHSVSCGRRAASNA